MIHFKKKILDNGLRIIAAPMANTNAITFSILIGTGSRYEKKEINGASHFLEHMAFKGTKGWPKSDQIHKELNKIGADYNAFTDKEVTEFWIKASAENFDLILEIISDMVLNPLLKDEEFKKEKKVILEEINMKEDNPKIKVLKVLENILYPNHPLGWDILGTKESIKKIKKSDLLRYRKTNYLSQNIIISIAGHINLKKVFKKIEKKFRKIKKGNNQSPQKIKIFQEKPRIKIIEKELEQAHFSLAAGGYNIFDERRYGLNLFSIILGGNTSSRLFLEIREKLGLSYYIYSWTREFLDCGYLGINAGVSNKNLEETIIKIGEIIKKIKEKRVSFKELNRAKSFIRGQMALSFETSDEIASFIAQQELFYKKILQPEEIIKKFEKVNQDEILKIANDVLKPQKMNLVIIGQKVKEKEEAFKKILGKI